MSGAAFLFPDSGEAPRSGKRAWLDEATPRAAAAEAAAEGIGGAAGATGAAGAAGAAGFPEGAGALDTLEGGHSVETEAEKKREPMKDLMVATPKP